MKKFILILLVILSVCVFVSCNKETTNTNYSYDNGEKNYNLNFINNYNFSLTETITNGYHKTIITREGSYYNVGDDYTFNITKENHKEYYFDTDKAIRDYDNDVSLYSSIKAKLINKEILLFPSEFIALSVNKDTSNNIVTIFNKDTSNIKIAQNSTKEDIAPSLNLGILYGNGYLNNIKIKPEHITTINSENLGNSSIGISYNGFNTSLLVEVIQPGLEKKLDISSLPTYVKRGDLARDYCRDQKVLLGGEEIILTTSMIGSDFNTDTIGTNKFTITVNGITATKSIKVYDLATQNRYERIQSISLKEDTIFYPNDYVGTSGNPNNINDYFDSVNLLGIDGTITSIPVSDRTVNVTGLNRNSNGQNNVVITFTDSLTQKVYSYTQPFYFYAKRDDTEICQGTTIQYLEGNDCVYLKDGVLELAGVRYTTQTCGYTPKKTSVKESDILDYSPDKVSEEGTDFIIPITTYSTKGTYTFYQHILIKKYVAPTA